MDAVQAAYSVALTIGAIIVGWACLGVNGLQQRVTRLETKLDRCTCQRAEKGE